MFTNNNLLLFSYLLFFSFCNGYVVPDATVEVFSPRGFRVSIPDEGDVELFAFHGKINEEMDGREAGTFSKDILKPKNGRWIFEDKNTKLNIGDTLYYWTYVIRNDKVGHPKDDQKYIVTSFSGSDSTTSTTTTTTQIPDIDIRFPEVTPEPPSKCQEYSQTKYNNGTSACRNQLLFYNKQNAYYPEIKFAVAPDYEFVVYTSDQKTIDQRNVITIEPKLIENVFGEGFIYQPLDLGKDCTGKIGSSECFVKPEAGFILPPVVSAQIHTKPTFAFKYGKIEIRAKLPKGDWIYPELFLAPLTNHYGPGYDSGQIRIAFAPGNDNFDHTLYGGVMLGSSKAARKYGMKPFQRVSSWTEDFHNFTVLWKPSSISFYADGKRYGIIKPPTEGFATLSNQLGIPNANKWSKGSKMAPFDKEMYIVLGVGVGGFNFDDDMYPNKPWRNGARLTLKNFYNAKNDWFSTWDEDSKLIVEHVKVWAL